MKSKTFALLTALSTSLDSNTNVVTKTVTLPIDEDKFYSLLQEKINNSTYKKVVKEVINENMDSTY